MFLNIPGKFWRKSRRSRPVVRFPRGSATPSRAPFNAAATRGCAPGGSGKTRVLPVITTLQTSATCAGNQALVSPLEIR